MLVVKPLSMNYSDFWKVSVAHSFEEAKRMIIAAEVFGNPYDDLDLPVDDEKTFWDFVTWMHQRGCRYPFSIFGQRSSLQFMRIRDKVRSMGFHFNS